MSPKSAAILTDPHPAGHIVYPYTDETQVADAVSLFTSAGLRKGESVLLVISNSHRDPIRHLEAQGFDLTALEAAGQLTWQDSHDLLSTFMFDGIIDEHVFKTKIGGLIEKVKAGRETENRPVRVFGEMVNAIWKTCPQATERLERLWNDVIEAHSVPLLCAYSLVGAKPNALPHSLMECHSHAVA
jgi:hypothetical protein